jgi:hypothetical protein
MERLKATDAWKVLGLGVLAYELLCPEGELLSEGVDRALEHSKVARYATLGAIAVTATHLANLLPNQIDPFHHAHKLVKRLS